MQIAGGADIEGGDMLFSCKEGKFSEEVATQRILALRKKASTNLPQSLLDAASKVEEIFE